MNIIIDWLSFTVPVSPFGSPLDDEVWLMQGLQQYLPDALLSEGDFALSQPKVRVYRRPYSHHVIHAPSLMNLFYSAKHDHALVELSGQACAWMRERNYLDSIVHDAASRLSRLDIAVDIECSETPSLFLESRKSNRQRTHAEFRSDLGETIYLGSMKSENYVRVYRYNDPHPRSRWLRIEFVFRRKHAQIIAAMLRSSSLSEVVAALGKRHGFEHPVWQPDAEPAALARIAPQEHRSDAGALFWLNKQVAPALVRLAREGKIDPQKWLDDEVLSKLGN